ncbi:hypothetical protein Poli38472_003461 [Pythium oligandrum]|uniref:Elicitin-like protein n=1 Tax=Pythium oligandrum TaxID=41045 RepID=A0A8K1C6W9_PYTOL|nr:hypothetical protein Poli38472_003461 [Pythium oligandrum]|eukprot:TMW57536.1 hypothetical protein Poli38472_003461 [Pythium oligandrum]
MKFAAIISTASLAVASAYEEAKECRPQDYSALRPLASNPNLHACQDNMGWQLLPPVGYPSSKDLDFMCLVPECLALMNNVKALGLSDCVLNFDGVKVNFKKLSEEFGPRCSGWGASVHASNSDAGNYAPNGSDGSHGSHGSYSYDGSDGSGAYEVPFPGEGSDGSYSHGSDGSYSDEIRFPGDDGSYGSYSQDGSDSSYSDEIRFPDDGSDGSYSYEVPFPGDGSDGSYSRGDESDVITF